MARLELRFFGTFSIRLARRAVKLDRRKAEALLAYLVVEGRPYRRSELALLLWPEQSSPSARSALRRTLFALNEAIGKEWLAVDRDNVGLHRPGPGGLWSDVGAFEVSLARARDHSHGDAAVCADCVEEIARAVLLHRADFLAGLTLRDAPSFDEWQRLRAEHFRELRGRAIEGLVGFHTARGTHEEALQWARERVRQDPLDEACHEALLVTLLAAGRRGAALRLYEAYERRLERELGIEPPASMRELLRRPRPIAARSPVVTPLPSSPVLQPSFAAWRDACQRRDIRAIDGSLERLHDFVDRRGFYREGIELLEVALGAADEGSILGRILARQGALYGCIGHLAKARALIAAGLKAALQDASVAETAFCQNRLGCVLFAQGEYARAMQLLRGSVSRYREASSVSGLPWALNVWGHLSIGSKNARKLLEESLDRARRAEDAQRIASTLNSLGKEALARGDLASAERELKQSLERRQEREHRIGIADTLNNLGHTYVGLRRIRDAERAFEEAFDIARQIEARPLLAEILLGMAELSATENGRERAVELASSALHLRGGWRDARDRARTRLEELTACLPATVAAGALAKGKRAGLQELP